MEQGTFLTADMFFTNLSSVLFFWLNPKQSLITDKKTMNIAQIYLGY